MVKTLEELYVDEIKDIYSAENQLVKALPKIANAVSTPELKAAIEAHLEETKGQIVRLDSIFEMLGEPKKGKMCEAMKGLLEEGSGHIEEVEKGPVLDAALIGAAQKVEHYEMAAYGTAHQFAKLLGYRDQADLLQATLDEEGAADHKLNEIAMGSVNAMAAECEENPKVKKPA